MISQLLSPFIIRSEKTGREWRPKLAVGVLLYATFAMYGYFAGKPIARFGMKVGLSFVSSSIMTLAIISGGVFLFFVLLKRLFARPITIRARWVQMFFCEVNP